MWHGCWSEPLNDMENLEDLVLDQKRNVRLDRK